MSVLQDLKRQRRLYAQCPSCDEEFRLADGDLFDATRPLDGRALEHLDELLNGHREACEEFKDRRIQTEVRSRVAAQAVNIGKVVEKIAPSLPGFPVNPADCRSLFEPIDYVVFDGLATRGLIEAVYFVDVKSGNAQLSWGQKEVRRVVDAGEVSLVVAPDTVERHE